MMIKDFLDCMEECVSRLLSTQNKSPSPAVSCHCRERVSLRTLEEGCSEVHELGDDRTSQQRKRWVKPSQARNRSGSLAPCWFIVLAFFPPTGESTIFSSAPMGFYILGSMMMLIGAKYLAGQSVQTPGGDAAGCNCLHFLCSDHSPFHYNYIHVVKHLLTPILTVI